MPEILLEANLVELSGNEKTSPCQWNARNLFSRFSKIVSSALEIFTSYQPSSCWEFLYIKLFNALAMIWLPKHIPIIGLTGSGYWDFREFGGIKTDKSSNSNQSDVNLVVPGAADSGNMYTVIAEFKKLY